MTIHFGSGEDIDFARAGDFTSVDTVAGRFDSAYARNSLRTEAAGTITFDIDTPIATFYLTARYNQNNPTFVGADAAPITIFEGSTPVARIKTTAGVWRLQTRESAAWVNRGSSFSTSPGSAPTLNKLTLKVVLHASTGEITAWVGNVQVATFTGDTIGDTGATGLDTVTLRSNDDAANQDAYWSEVIVADEQTINMRVATLVPNGDGNQVDWVNGFAAVDEIAVSAEDTIQSASANEVELMTLTNYAGSTDLVVRTVFVSAKAIRGASGPQNLQLAVREGVTDGFSANKALTEVYTTFKNSFTTNPDTGPAAWDLTELDTMEAGVKSIA